MISENDLIDTKMNTPKFKVPITVSRGGGSISEQDVNAWEEKNSLQLPSDYREFLCTWNGGLLTPSSIDLSEDSVLSYARPAELREHYEQLDDAPSSFINIGDDFGGNHFFICLHRYRYGQIFWGDHEMMADTGIIRRMLEHTPIFWRSFFPNLRFVAHSFSDLCERLYCNPQDYIEHITRTNDIDALKELVNLHGKDFKSEIGTPLIETIAWNGTPEMVEYLLNEDPKLEESLLRSIVNEKDCGSIMDMLLKHGADPNIRGAHFSALELAKKKANCEAEALLVKYGATL